MQVKKKYNHGGIHNWPPGTEVMASDNTSVASPQLNFLANQLLPAQVTSNIEAEMLNREGIPAVSTQPGRPSQEYVRGMNMLKSEMRRSEAQVQALVNEGFTEEAARQHLAAYNADPLNRPSGAINPVYPVMEFLSPVGDVLAMGEAAGQVLQGNVAAGALGGGLAAASIFLPGTVRGDAIADDMIRNLARSNVRAGAVNEDVLDIIEYVQEVATPGNIRFGSTRSEAVGGGPRVFREPRMGPTTGPDRGYMREFIDRPTTNVADSPYQSGRSVAATFGASGSGISDISLEQTRDVIRNFTGTNTALNPAQTDYYQGIIDGINEVLPPPGSSRIDFPRTGRVSRRGTTDPYAITRVRNRPGTAAAPAPKAPDRVNIGDVGGQPLTYRIQRGDPQGDDVLYRMRSDASSAADSGFRLELKAQRAEDGQIDHDFFLNSGASDYTPMSVRRRRELIDGGMDVEQAKGQVRVELDAAINAGLRRMYDEVPVGQNIMVNSYSVDSYPLMLQGLKGGKYQTITPPSGYTLMGDMVEMHPLNTMGTNFTLFKRMDMGPLQTTVAKLRARTGEDRFDDYILQESKKFMVGKKPTEKNLKAAENFATQKLLLEFVTGYGRTNTQADDLLAKEIGEAFVGHINKQIKEINEDSVDALIRYRAKEKGIPLQEAEVEIMNEFIPLPDAQFSGASISVPTPRSKKIRAEVGAYLTVPKFKMKKKKGAYGMRVKK